MTRDVVTIRKGAPVKEAARLMVRRRISGLPVTDADHRLVGVISETDVLRTVEAQSARDAARLPLLRRRRVRARGRGGRVIHLMGSPPVTVAPDRSLVAAARLLDRHGIRRLPVVDAGGRLVGIVTRHDLVRALLMPDEQLARQILTQVFDEGLGTNTALVHVLVQDGVVTLSGEVTERSMIPAAVESVRSMEGVIDVREHLTYAVDDRHLPRTVDLTDY
jgi:CBS domain-containing protein